MPIVGNTTFLKWFICLTYTVGILRIKITVLPCHLETPFVKTGSLVVSYKVTRS